MGDSIISLLFYSSCNVHYNSSLENIQCYSNVDIRHCSRTKKTYSQYLEMYECVI